MTARPRPPLHVFAPCPRCGQEMLASLAQLYARRLTCPACGQASPGQQWRQPFPVQQQLVTELAKAIKVIYRKPPKL